MDGPNRFREQRGHREDLDLFTPLAFFRKRDRVGHDDSLED